MMMFLITYMPIITLKRLSYELFIILNRQLLFPMVELLFELRIGFMDGKTDLERFLLIVLR